MKTNMNFTKKCFMTFTVAATFFAAPCFSAGSNMFRTKSDQEAFEQHMSRVHSYEEMVHFYKANKHAFEKWAGAAGATGGWGFFFAKGRPWGRQFLFTFLSASSMIAAGRFFPTEPEQNNHK